MAIERNKVSYFFPTTKHEALKGSSFDFQIPDTNHFRMFCKDLTIISCLWYLPFMPLVSRHRKMTHHSYNVTVIHVGFDKQTFFFFNILDDVTLCCLVCNLPFFFLFFFHLICQIDVI